MFASVGGVGLLIIGALALLWFEPGLNRAVCFLAFGGYTLLAAAFVSVVNEWIRVPVVEAGSALSAWVLNSYGVHLVAFAALLGGCLVWALVRLAVGARKEAVAAPETAQVEHTQQSNWVPAQAGRVTAPPRRRYRSMTRKTLNAIKVHKPKEHFAVRTEDYTKV